MAMDDLDTQLQTMFAAEASPPALRVWQLEQLAKQQEQRRLLLFTSLLSFCWNGLYLVLAVLLLKQNPLLGSGMLCALLFGLLGAGLLTAAMLKTEQQEKRSLFPW